jgi:hypothetical protein
LGILQPRRVAQKKKPKIQFILNIADNIQGLILFSLFWFLKSQQNNIFTTGAEEVRSENAKRKTDYPGSKRDIFVAHGVSVVADSV